MPTPPDPDEPSDEDPDGPAVRDPALPSGFGRKCMWLAVRASDPGEVAQAIGLKDPRPASWGVGVAAGYRGTRSTVFVTPSVDGWVFILGTQAPGADSELVERLSARLGEAQWFGTHRGSSAGGWIRAVGGRMLRLVGFGDGEVHECEGEPTPIEIELGLKAHDTSTPLEEAYEDVSLDEEEVLRVAGAWSLDPTTLEDRDTPRAPGLIGRFPISPAHKFPKG